MANNGRNNDVNEGLNPMVMIAKLWEELAKLGKHSVDDTKAIRSLKRRLGEEEEKGGDQCRTHFETVE